MNKFPSIVLMQGLPGSGKSFEAKKLLDENSIIVSRDSLREMIYGNVKGTGRFDRALEKLVTQAEFLIAEEALKMGKSVIVDDTNLKTQTVLDWKQFAGKMNTFARIQAVDTPVGECLLRDYYRHPRVGSVVILQMAERYGIEFKNREDYISTKNHRISLERYFLCDLDGTIADCTHRQHFVAEKPKNWKQFFLGIPNDPVREDVKELLKGHLKTGLKVVFVSARSEDQRFETEHWLKQQGFENFELLMRGSGDFRPDHFVKKEILDKYLDPKRIVFVVDDRPSVVRMWRDSGLVVIDVGTGVEF
ncbi:MAG: AAA family ATPase [Candidatus Pacearchaeota archaeon]